MACLFIASNESNFNLEQAITFINNLLGSNYIFTTIHKYGHSCAYVVCDYKEQDYLKLKQAMLDGLLKCDFIYQEHKTSLNTQGMLLMDMDMTTVQIEGIDEIARLYHVYDAVASITHEAMQGKLDFASSLTKRVSLLQGASTNILQQVKHNMPQTQGLDLLFKCMDLHQWKKGIASGGFTQLIAQIDEQYKLDMIKANTLEVDNGYLTGKVVGQIVDAKVKQQAFLQMLNDFNIDPKQTICLGDGANDLLMLNCAALAIAYHAKPKVVAEAKFAFNYCSLEALVIYLGL